jgi:TonB family protein
MKSKTVYLNFLIMMFASYLTNSLAQKSTNQSLPEILYYVDTDNDGKYTIISIEKDKRPEPLQGEAQFNKELSRLLRYPAIARANGIEGIVLLDVSVDENGKVTDIMVDKSVSKECDETAREAFINASKQGYWPLIINEKTTKFKMACPIKFKLEGRK